MASKQRQQPSFSHASTVRSSVGVETLEHNTGSNGSPNHFNENNTLNSTSHFNHYSNITNSNSFNISKDENNVASAAFEFPEPLKKKTEARGPVPRLDIHLLRGEEEEKQARLPPMSNELVMQPPTILEMAPTQETTPEKPMHYTTHKIEDFELDDDVYFIDGTSKTVAKEKMAKKSFETSPFSGSGGRTAGKTQPSPVIDPWRNPSKFASQGFDLSPWEQKGYFQRRDVFSDLHGLRPENPIMSAEPKRPFDWDRLGGYYPPLGHPKPSSQDYVPSPSPARKNTSNSTTKMRHAHQAAFDNKASYEQWNHNLKDSMNVTNVLYPIYMEVGIIRNELDDLKKSVSVAVQYSARSEEMAETGTQTEMAAADHRAESNKPKGKVSSVRGERREEPIPEPLVIMFPEIRTEPRVVPLPPTKHSRPAVKLSDGSTYEGEWFGDVKEGLGILVYPDGAIYTGEFKEDKKHGRGKLCTAKGHDVYEGDFQNDVINGYGVFTSPNLFCEGFWANGQMEGIGAMKYKGGMAYEGNFKGGKKEGEGRLIFPNQDIYKGAFLNDVPHGNVIHSPLLRSTDCLKVQDHWVECIFLKVGCLFCNVLLLFKNGL